MTVAIFDLDRTLLDAHSSFAWVKHELMLGKLGIGFGLWIGFWLLRERVGLSHGWEEAYHRAVVQWSGQEHADLAHRGRAFATKTLVPRIRPGARPVLAAHRAAGDRMVLASASPDLLVRPIAEAWGLELIAATELETRDGRMTGRIANSAMGEAKKDRVLQWARDERIDLSTAHAYSDSWHDLPLLEAVGSPTVVNPDLGLATIARQRQWPIVDWGRAR